MHDAQARILADDASDEPLELLAIPDQYELDVLVFCKGRGRSTNDDLGTEVAAHGIKGNCRQASHHGCRKAAPSGKPGRGAGRQLSTSRRRARVRALR
jgi:hypothetical protein